MDIRDYNNGDKTIYIENSDKEFFEKMREIWNKVIELININNAPNFVNFVSIKSNSRIPILINIIIFS